MAQMQLPIFPVGVNQINANVGFAREDDTIIYFYGHLPIFRHQVSDMVNFRLITSQLHVDGNVKQADICRAFGVTPISVKRSVKIYREKGPAGFFEKPRRRGPAVLTKPVLAKIQDLLDEGMELPEIAHKLDLLADTIRKAVKAGKLHKPQKKMTRHRP
jgi:transposase